MDWSAGGRGSRPGSCLGEGIIGGALLVGKMEALGLQIEHGAVATTQRYQLIVCTESDDPALLQHADAVSMANGRKAMGNQDGGAVPGGGQETIEDLGFSPD